MAHVKLELERLGGFVNGIQFPNVLPISFRVPRVTNATACWLCNPLIHHTSVENILWAFFILFANAAECGMDLLFLKRVPWVLVPSFLPFGSLCRRRVGSPRTSFTNPSDVPSDQVCCGLKVQHL